MEQATVCIRLEAMEMFHYFSLLLNAQTPITARAHRGRLIAALKGAGHKNNNRGAMKQLYSLTSACVNV
ncbi:hypothetical protein AOLI_G00101370 [Acnodon oligacanthus]